MHALPLSPFRHALRSATVLCAVLVAFFVAGLSAHAEDSPFNFNYSTSVGAGAQAWLKFTCITSIDRLSVTVESAKSGKTWKFKSGNMAGGETAKFEWDTPAGTVDYVVYIDGETGSGNEFNGETTITVQSRTLLVVGADLKNSNLRKGKVVIEGSRPLARAEVEVFGEGKSEIAKFEARLSGKRGEITWQPDEDVKPVLVNIMAYDADGSWAGIQIFRLEVPHADVVFDSDKAKIRNDQEHKLEETRDYIANAVKTYDEVDMQLYIGGYTDTVGSNGDNKKLSNKRAKALAKWFRKNGIEIPVFYYGFGEESLAVDTGDGVDDERNRRAVYVLSNSKPSGGRDFPSPSWREIK